MKKTLIGSILFVGLLVGASSTQAAQIDNPNQYDPPTKETIITPLGIKDPGGGGW
jgi:hypothetical protein